MQTPTPADPHSEIDPRSPRPVSPISIRSFSGLPKTSSDASGLSTTQYASSAQKLIALINDVRSIGANITKFNIPRIVVIGNQSAGKSSLVEAITGIKVPRAPGTCTRCPMECRLYRRDVPWQCQIYLRYEHEAPGLPFKPGEEFPFGGVIRQKEGLDNILLRAQLALLTLNVHPREFLQQQLPPAIHQAQQFRFSGNVISLEITGPDLPDLTFIDLPGIITNVGPGEDPAVIPLVRGLVLNYIQDPNSLILLAISMREDMDLQGAALLAKEVDPKGKRTLGVLTKPDTVLEGEEAQWIDIMEGKRHKSKHGYFVTKHPGPMELKRSITPEEARRDEEAFFATSSWIRAVPSMRKRTGTRYLVAELSTLLTLFIQRALPQLRDDTRDALALVDQQLSALPGPPSDNPIGDLLRLISEFKGKVAKYIEGVGEFPKLRHKAKEANHLLKRELSSTVPLFFPWPSEHVSVTRGQVLEFDDSDCHVPSEATPGARLEMDLTQMQEHIENSVMRELPLHLPFPAIISLWEKCFKTWGAYANACFITIYAEAAEILIRLARDVFKDFANRLLFEHVLTAVERQLRLSKKVATDALKLIMSLEKRPSTNNGKYYEFLAHKYEAQYRAAGEIRASVLSGTQAGNPNVSVQRLHEGYEAEIAIMSQVQAYFRIAYKRVIDNVPHIIDQSFLWDIDKNIEGTMQSELGLDSHEAMARATDYLAEQPEIAAQRNELIERRERLEKIMRRLAEVQQ